MNKDYKSYLLGEHFKLGSDEEAFKTEAKLSQAEATSSAAQLKIKREFQDGVTPAHQTIINKKRVENQAFNIKQPQLSGDVFAANDNARNRPMTGLILETIKEDGSPEK